LPTKSTPGRGTTIHHTNNSNHPTPATGPDLRVLCHHTFESTDTEAARRCGSPALRGETFCFYHHPTRKPAKNREARRERRIARRPIPFPLPTNRAELLRAQLYLTHLIASNQIDTRRAGLLLFALQNLTKSLNE
jgi:hypothetical protein